MCPDETNDAQEAGQEFPSHAAWREITDARVLAAFARVDRRRFVPESMRPYAHRDEPLPIGEGQTVSQPFVIALMLQALQLQPGDRVLEIGTGSGFQTALLCEIVQLQGQPAGATVYSVERHQSLLEPARSALQAAGYAPQLAVGDGALGWADEGPFHGIVVSAAARAVPRPLVEQLADGGHLVIPVDVAGDEQELWLIQRLATRLEWRALGPVRFVPLVSPVLQNPLRRIMPPADWSSGHEAIVTAL